MPGPSIVDAVEGGNYSLEWFPVTLRYGDDILECLATSDAIKDSEGLRLTCNPLEMATVFPLLWLVTATPFMLDARYEACPVKNEPCPKYYPGGRGMNTDKAVRDHSARVDAAQKAVGGGPIVAVPGKFWCAPLSEENLYGGHVTLDGSTWKGIRMYPTIAGLPGVKVFQTRSSAHTGANKSEVEDTHEDYMMTAVGFYRWGMLNGKPADLQKLIDEGHPVVWGPEKYNRPPPQIGRPEILHSGMRGPWVRSWQARLTSAGILLPADGEFGPTTKRLTERAQRAYGLPVTGVVDSVLWDAAANPIEWPELPTRTFGLMSVAEKQKLFGMIEFKLSPTRNNPEAITITNGWDAKNIALVPIPQLGKKIAVNRFVAHQFAGFFAEVEAEGLLPLIKSVDGFWVPRLIRGRSTLSNHAYGTAMDFNYRWNQLGREPAGWYEEGTLLPLVAIAMRWGFVWGGDFRRKDGGHFEIGRVITK